jgi:hypothetical protein
LTSLRKRKSTQFTELVILYSWKEAQFKENWSQSQLNEKFSKRPLRILPFGKTRKIRLVTRLWHYFVTKAHAFPLFVN